MVKKRKRDGEGDGELPLDPGPRLLFRSRWRWAAELGRCDEIDGTEYKRVLAEWEVAGCPDTVDQFIRERASKRAPRKE